MNRRIGSKGLIVVSLLVVLCLLVACGGTPSPTATVSAPTQGPTSVPPTATRPAATAVPPTATAIPPTPTVGPQVGGAWVLGLVTEPQVLDPHKSYEMLGPNFYMGASPFSIDPTTGEYVPYLAESWQISPDGLSVEFKLKKGIKFHDGAPLTAADYAWTFERLIAPEIMSPVVGSFLTSLNKAEAIDDLTVRLTLTQPYFAMMFVMTIASFTQPLEKAQVEAAGEQFGQPGGVPPVGVGPFKFKSWVTGQKIVLERNADFSWGPDYIGDAPYIETLEFRYIPESATLAAGLESGEINQIGGVPVTDMERAKASGQFQIIESVSGGAGPCVILNHSKPPFDDLRVRKAFNLAVDRQALSKVVAGGYAEEQYGPVSSATIGYWPEVEKIGYGTDLARAKELMKEAGYVAGADGMLSKDGEPLSLDLLSWSFPQFIQSAQVLQEDYKALGVTVEIKQQESATYISDLLAGKFQIATFLYGYPEFDTVVTVFGSGAIGGMDFAKANDPELDRVLQATRTATDPVVHQQACNDAQKYMVERAVMIPLISPKDFTVASKSIRFPVDPTKSMLSLVAAYIVK